MSQGKVYFYLKTLLKFSSTYIFNSDQLIYQVFIEPYNLAGLLNLCNLLKLSLTNQFQKSLETHTHTHIHNVCVCAHTLLLLLNNINKVYHYHLITLFSFPKQLETRKVKSYTNSQEQLKQNWFNKIVKLANLIFFGFMRCPSCNIV